MNRTRQRRSRTFHNCHIAIIKCAVCCLFNIHGIKNYNLSENHPIFKAFSDNLQHNFITV